MPAVPYKGYGDVEPTGASTPSVRISTPVEAFGGGVAQAIGHLGKTIEGAGDELWRRAVALQEVRNKADAEEAETRFMMRSGELHAEFNSLQGKAAVDAFPKYQEDLQTAREAIKGGLGNDYTKRLYDSASRGILGRHIFNGAGHAAAQNKRYIAGTSAANLASIQDYVMHNPGDESAYDDGIQRTITEIKGTQAAVAGWGFEQTKDETRKAISRLTAARIVGLARTQPLQAKEMFDRYKDRLYGDDVDRADKVILGQSRTIGSRIMAEEAGASDLSVPLEKAITEGERLANKAFPDDPTMADYVRDRVIGTRNRMKAVRRETDFDNREVIDGAFNDGNKSGKLPGSIEELVAINPKVQEAWENLSERDQRKYLKVLAQNIKGGYALTPENFKEYQKLKGMAGSEDPETVEKFLYTDIMSLEMPNQQKAELFKLWQQRRKKIDADPRVMSALRDLAPMMNAAGIDKKKDETGYYQFRAGLADALDDFQKRNPGKIPTSKERQEIGSRLIQELKDPEKWSFGGLISRTTRLFEQPVPEERKTAITQDWIADKGRPPTDEEVRRVYVMKLYHDLYGGAPKKPKLPGDK